MIKKTLIVLAICLCSCEKAGLFFQKQTPAQFEIKENAVYLRGVLGKTAYFRFRKILNKNSQIDTLVFVQSNGSENDDYNLLTAKLIQRNQIMTKLLPDSEIASGAVDLFLAGSKRFVPKGAKLGIHSWRDETQEGRFYPKYDENHKMFWEYYQNIGIDTSFYWYTLYIAPSDSIHWMTEAEIIKFNIRKE